MAGGIAYGTSWVELCNRALASLGKERISSLSVGDNSVQLCNTFLGEAIETVLSAFSFSTTKKRVQLAELATLPAYGFAHAYALPADLVNICQVDVGGADYRSEGGAILTDEDEVWITYTARPTDPSILPGYLKRAISMQLAYLMAPALVSSEATAQRIAAETKASLEAAISEDARRAPPGERVPWYDEAR